ncbi:CHASE2 domain-containing protein [uncultured Erythrobacter sp.]|uniref:CHASE2 domain-containing protein n=1 Tax=uncultured Erythrobacter sp. TaxID=263913 RepID=UPI00262EC502|nr:CHASE2 domain-containing protein [uncultured Erythrobacter sp.]
MRPKAKRTIIAAVLAGALVGVLLSIFGGEFQRRLVFDSWQNWAPRSDTSDQVVVVMIDDASVEAKGQWPWRRTDVAALLENIAIAEPAVIGIDIYFTEPDRLRPQNFAELYTEDALDEATRAKILTLPYGDQYLASVIETAPTVMPWVTTNSGGRSLSELTFEAVEGEPPVGIARAERMLTSIPLLDDVALAKGVVVGPPDSDGIVRRVPLSVMAGDTVTPGFAVQLANIASGGGSLRWTEEGLIGAGKIVPSDPTANLEFKMSTGWEEDVITALDVLNGNVDVEEMHGKVVLLGFGATGTTDIVATPVSSETQGTLVQAQAVDAILNGHWLARPSWAQWLEIAFALALVAMLIVAGIGFAKWLVFAAIGVGALLPIGSFIAYDSAGLLIDPARPIVIALCAGIALVLVRYALTFAELVEKRIVTAEQEKENESARKLQLTMVPSAARLAKLGTRTEIGAVLEPAKSVGGDFYDAMELEGNRLAFLVGDVSGKGLRAALFMALSKSVSKNNLLRSGDDLGAAVRQVNTELMAEEDEEMDLTLLVGIIDCSTGMIEMVNAGHEDPMLVRPDGSIEVVKMTGGLRLRTLDEFPYEVEKLQMKPGESLVIVTDGATDAMNVKGDRFGLDRVLEALKDSAQSSAPERVRHIAGKVRAFERGMDPADDLTILVLRYLGKDAAASKSN